ncbi:MULTISPECIES: mandelate racemase/muconate lactonizing enzyme family protein [Rhizobium/Agrobacterium group]|uniref:Mandelate racemase/muconate lactonizing enzyme family protein n=2 Tax=Neorhizobium TaxID=1525371 RepID=A0ABV0M931_9HYPH|nr:MULTISPECIES: mandelate racemase/muconate lactonizing enzyme family protein [Rhizobium/Agrobacterium group]KGD96994.1 isomerase [Rhizobium sp. YS-1r]MCC2613066.1 mandelate racemase/muconate lactonizing enzyme family protein [Neorhizobium petrolearium]WGI68163.1 mandelate racemase/muconate lactonizing enzyme family protein [Neorhizobium petrolearium]
MKITGIRTFLMHAGQPHRSKWASDGHAGHVTQHKLEGTRNWLFLKIETDEGITGIGECSGWPRVIETAIKDLAPLLIGEDPAHIEKLWQKMAIAMMGHGMLGTVGGGAMTGIDMALWDIKGKALGVPVWNLLGGKVRDRIPIYSHANTVEQALAVKERGIKALKCGGVSDPVRKVDMLREAVGDEMDIAIDLHGPPWMTPADACRLVRKLEPYELLWVEDPIAPDNIEGYRRIRDAAHIPLASGERTATIFGERQLIEEELVDVIQPDTGRAGGITQMKKIAAMAEAHHIQMAPHSGSLGPVAEYAALHVLASIPNALILERIDDDWEGRQHVIVPHPVQEGGSIAVPDAPGLGCDIDEEFVARFPSEGNVSVPVQESGNSYNPGTYGERLYIQTRLSRRHYFNT